jgi:hypothetical protein
MSTATESALVAPRLPEENVEVPGVGTVRVRSLSRAEVLEAKGTHLSPADEERKLLAASLVSPKLTEKAVAKWQAASAPGEIEKVVDAVVRLSGLDEGTAKEAVKSL